MNQGIIDELIIIDDKKREENIAQARKQGAVIPCTEGVIIGDKVKIGKGTVILTGSLLLGETVVGNDCVIGPNSLLYNVKTGDRNFLNAFQGVNGEIKDDCDIGPYTQMRPDCVIGSGVHLGNFVEVKNSNIGEKTSVSHLTYIGDSDVGREVNFGCGCVTVNYDGKEKHRTTVGNHSFLGCNTNLVAPVKVGDYAFTAAGSTITEDVPENSLGIARARQVNKINWVLKKKPYKGME